MLIGLNGRKQAGKDTVYGRACHLMRDVLEVERLSFADMLYESAAASLGVDVTDLRSWKSDPDVVVSISRLQTERSSTGIAFTSGQVLVRATVREYLQRYGTEAHRDLFGDDFWVEQVEARLRAHEGRLVMVTDCRFENEASAIRKAGGVIVEVIGPEGRATDDKHTSEAPLPERLIDVTLYNRVRDDDFRHLDGTVDTLLKLALGGAFSVAVEWAEDTADDANTWLAEDLDKERS